MNISYELAKELKEAGFRQGDWVGATFYHPIAIPRMGIPHQIAVTTQVAEGALFSTSEPYVYIPTLSELIEACPTISTIHRSGMEEDGEWAADTVDYPDVYGRTPEEAVARLWLALKKKV